MTGTWRWNIVLGFVAAIPTFLVSYASNPLGVSGIRAVYAFTAMFVLSFALRAMLGMALRPPVLRDEAGAAEENKGGQLDLTTPDETDDLNGMLKRQWEAPGAVQTPENPGSRRTSVFSPFSRPA
ncbi:hypothetical protein PACILC2_10010 [Paenibacillus cisolokensis]|uniref:Uncharacterized protein n=2 Tax=Paenibacillus cisolokensis TaxID=1658519 RepID=A0ABQ4N2T3_9BACL|nr:hypothetical protein PACILC2_10010 [Paenibacillus cisolokensis]